MKTPDARPDSTSRAAHRAGGFGAHGGEILTLIEGYFSRYGRPRQGSRILAAVSGGPDSVAMLNILVYLAPAAEWTIAAAHVNHGLRGSESEADHKFVRAMARRLGTPMHSCRLTPDSRAKNGNLQAWARTHRYQFLEATANRYSYTHIAVAHQLDDRAETVAAAVLDAGGTFSLSGIPPVRGNIIRPLFDVPRELIAKFMSEAAIPYRVDASNHSTRYQRTRIRHEFLPAWSRENPEIVSGLARLGEQAWGQRRFLTEQASHIVNRAVTQSSRTSFILDARKLSRYDAALDPYVLRELIGRLGMDLVPTPATVARFTGLRRSRVSGKLATIEQGGFSIVRSQGFLKMTVQRTKSSTEAPSEDREIVATLNTRIIQKPDRHKSNDHRLAHFDLDCVCGAISVRLPQPGDRYQPMGLEGTKKLFDLLADRKVPSFVRPLVPVVVDDQGILWPVGHPIAHRARLTSRTRRVLEARVLEGSWKKTS